MIDRFLELADIRDDSLLDLAIMTDNGLENWKSPRAHSCNNGQSTTKLFTSVAIALLMEEGALSYADSVIAPFKELYPENMDAGWQKVTIADALRHEMGIAEGFDIEGDVMPDDGNTDYLTLLFALPLPYKPGEYYKYSDIGYYLLARIAEYHAGMTMEAYLRKKLGRVMNLRDFAIASCPRGHSFGGGCMYARASDMVKLGYMLSCGGEYRGARVLREDTVRTMIEREYAIRHFRDTDIYNKTGAYGQCIAFSIAHRYAAAWHRTAYAVKPVPDRNDGVLSVMEQLEREYFTV